MKMFVASLYGDLIGESEVLSETPGYVTVSTVDGGARRHKKRTDYYCYTKTREEAKAWIVAVRTAKVHKAKACLNYEEERLAKAQSL